MIRARRDPCAGEAGARYRGPVSSLLALLLIAGAPTAAPGGHALQIDAVAVGAAAGSAQPSVAVEAGRGFVLTWQTLAPRGARLHYAAVDRAGALTGTGIVAEAATTGVDGGPARWFVNWADFPSLVVLDNGDWVTHWLQKNGEGSFAYAIQLTRSRDRGRTWSPPERPHADDSQTEHGFVSLLPAGGDRVRVVWIDGRDGAAAGAGHGEAHTGHGDADAGHGAMALRSRLLDRRGPVGQERLLDARTCSCCQTDAVRLGRRSLVVYRDEAAGDLRDIHWIAHDGRTWGRDRVLHADGWRIAACPVNGPALAADGRRVLAVWPTQAGAGMAVRMALGDGRSFASPVELDAGTGVLGRVDVAPWVDGGWLALWLGAGEAPGSAALKLAELDRSLRVRQVRVLASLPAGRSSGVPRLAARDGVALAAWTESAGADPQVRSVLIRASPR